MVERHDPMAKTASVLLLVFSLLIGGYARFSGLEYGLPLKLRVDEDYYALVVANMLRTGTADPGFFAYSSLAFYLPLGAAWVQYQWTRWVEEPEPPVAWKEMVQDETFMIRAQRRLAALLSTMTILLAAGIGSRLGGRPTGAISALICAIAPMAVRHAHFGVVDTTVTFFSALGLWAILRADARKSGRALGLAAVATGLAMATKYTPVVLLVPLAWVAFFPRNAADSPEHRGRWLRFIMAVGLACLVFFAVAPYTLISFARFRAHLLDTEGGFRGLAQAYSKFQPIVWEGLRLGLTWPVALLSIMGMALVLWARSRPGSLVVSFVVVSLLSLIPGGKAFHRYALPLVPALCALAAFPLVKLTMRWRFIGIPVIAAVGFLPALQSQRLVRLFRTPTTFEEFRADALSRSAMEPQFVFSDPSLERLLRLPAGRLRSFDPPAILASTSPVHLVQLVEPTLEGAAPTISRAAWERHAVLRTVSTYTRDESAACSSIFERADLCYFPVVAPRYIARAGATLELIEIVPRPDRPRTLPPPSPPSAVLAAVPDLEVTAIVATWSASSDPDCLGYYVRCIQEGKVTTTDQFLASPRQTLSSGITHCAFYELAPGSWRIAISSVNALGEGPPSISSAVVIQDR